MVCQMRGNNKRIFFSQYFRTWIFLIQILFYPTSVLFFFLMFQLNYQGYVYILKCNFSRFHHFIYKFQFQVSCNLLFHCLCLTRYVSLSTWQSVLSTQIWSIFMKNTTAVWQKHCKYYESHSKVEHSQHTDVSISCFVPCLSALLNYS